MAQPFPPDAPGSQLGVAASVYPIGTSRFNLLSPPIHPPAQVPPILSRLTNPVELGILVGLSDISATQIA